jgi:hypothetical protein
MNLAVSFTAREGVHNRHRVALATIEFSRVVHGTDITARRTVFNRR